MEENKNVTILNEYLANLKVLNNNLYNMHFNIVGMSFFGMHRKLQDYYEAVALQYDKVAERIKMLGGYPITSLKKIEDTSTMKSMRSMDYNGNQVLEVLQNDFGFMKVYTKDLVHTFEREGDTGTASMLGEFLQFYDKEFWMIDSSLK